ncbi:MAG: hypothetical protein LBU60_04105 [Clostridiales bacterium]|jgi:virulence-associated protein VapD|nr:hypothetical protein [Clostridiales bacterium]
MANQRKQIAFDLITTPDELPKHYHNANWRQGYLDIKQFMLDNGFEWRQGSVYQSKKPLPMIDIYYLIGELIKQHSWLNSCMRDCVVTNIGREFSMAHLFVSNHTNTSTKFNSQPKYDDCENSR